ncbi:tRNA (N6-isopentenyl adenosine(37)-C2)-methylthiotransferase MiaB [candidate division WWE3 bacterium CG_4_9_14_0_2_um_filter_35_11]|uniref:tRNA-2-methylthio-N(6)-dimethylallyladenosine synthase n=1 Tax=candidate division WWE3 bacterium CG_4_9_14_0_2_um_filter_35_11 TaxID=1975077 RepID=A0A2M8EMH7_UNCKA|nr:MAG: tRNA (N6-isopentenyl adenosine(37)-C2)-methylthiotransferase MiaB [candidate division WWE3 bacterium CG_4_9_14_0_2_um_filter_35_11]
MKIILYNSIHRKLSIMALLCDNLISDIKMKKYYIETFGCQANVKDSQAMSGTLDAMDFSQTDDYKGADVIIINTCSVRQKSEDKVYGWGMKLGNPIAHEVQMYEKKGHQIVFVTGCMIGSAKGDRKRYDIKVMKDKMPWADYMLAPDEEYKIPEILVKEGLVSEWTGAALFPDVAPEKRAAPIAYINISTGCDNFCTFCVVPYARGKEVSRNQEEILHEINHLVSRGYKRVLLIGQNVNSWGLDTKTKFNLRAGSEHKIPFAKLLREVHKIDGIEKISFISSNPFDFTQDLIDTLSLPKIDRYLHMAVQSGNNEILKAMNRRHTIEEFKELVTKIKKTVPDITFGTDIIVGFPGENEEQFMDTVELFKWMKFNVAFISIYSPRIGTNAQKNLKDDVPLKEKKRRHKYLMDVWKSTIS